LGWLVCYGVHRSQLVHVLCQRFLFAVSSKCVDAHIGLNYNFGFDHRDMDAADRKRMLEWTRCYDLLWWLIHLGERSQLRVFESLWV